MNLSFSTQGVCAKVANVCQHQGIPPPKNQEEVSQNQKGKVFFPMSIQLWRHSISNICPSPKNNNEVFCVLTT